MSADLEVAQSHIDDAVEESRDRLANSESEVELYTSAVRASSKRYVALNDLSRRLLMLDPDTYPQTLDYAVESAHNLVTTAKRALARANNNLAEAKVELRCLSNASKGLRILRDEGSQ